MQILSYSLSYFFLLSAFFSYFILFQEESDLSLSWSQELGNQGRRISSFRSFTASSSLYNHQIRGRKERGEGNLLLYSGKKESVSLSPLLIFFSLVVFSWNRLSSSLFLCRSFFFLASFSLVSSDMLLLLLPIRRNHQLPFPAAVLLILRSFSLISVMSLFFLLHVLFLNSSKLLIKGSSLLQWVFLVWAVPPHHRHNFFSVFHPSSFSFFFPSSSCVVSFFSLTSLLNTRLLT